MNLDFGKWAFNNRVLVYFLVGVLTLGGLYAAWRMPKLEDPEIKVKLAMVVTTYPGASAHEVEMQVTDPIEKSIRSMSGVDNVESYSYADVSIIQVELISTIAADEVEQHWDMLRRRVADAQIQLPTGARASVVRDDFSNVYGMFYCLTGDGMGVRELSDYAGLVKRELSNLEGVDRVQLYGQQQECINVTLHQDRLSALGINPIEVLGTLQGQNKAVYAGYYENGDQHVRVRVDGRFDTVESISRMLIQGHEDDQLHISDIATVTLDVEKPVRAAMTRDGEPSIGILVAPSAGADVVKVGRAIESHLDELRADRLPTGVEVHKVFYQPERVTDALSSFIINLIESVAIVVVILMFVMGFKSGLIIGASLCVIVFGSFLLLLGFDGTMQRVSLGSFILAMGMLVDNAIVIIDGILNDLKRGVSRREAMTNIGRRTAMPLLGATLIAILSFLPIFLSPDTAGVYVRDLFIVLAVSLLLSWILALTHVPLMANRLLNPNPTLPTGGGGEPVTSPLAEQTIDTPSPCEEGWGGVVLGSILRFGLRHRLLNLGLMLGFIALAVLGYGHMKQGFFPDMVYDQAYMEYKLPEGCNSTRVEKDLKEIEAWLRARPEVTHVTMSLGGTPGRYNLVRTIPTPSLSYGELIIDFTSPESLRENMDEIQQYLTANYPEAYCKLKLYNLMFKKYPIEVQFTGPDPAVLHALADSARAIMEADSRTCLVTSDWEPSVPVLNIDYDQSDALRAGLSRGDVAMSVLTATGGIPVGQFNDGIYTNNIYVKTVTADGRPVDDLSSLQLFSALPHIAGLASEENLVKLRTGNVSRETIIEALMGTTPLQAVGAGVSVQWEDPVIPRYNGSRMQRVQCSPAPGLETERTRAALAEKIERIELPAGYQMQWMGERQASVRSMKYLFANFPLAIILMIAILIALFKDLRKMLTIVCTIPLVFVGVVLTMLLTGKVFSFVAIVGALGLIGMIIKNCIVLMDEIDLEVSQGAPMEEALVNSAQSRLRPVMMASLTTILGMVPLLGDAMFGSLAATIMGGLLLGTIITLIFMPIIYALFFNIKSR